MADKLLPLSQLEKGKKAIIRQLNGGRSLNNRLSVLGFTQGEELSVQQNPGFGPVIVLVRDTRIALGRGEANRVVVEKTV